MKLRTALALITFAACALAQQVPVPPHIGFAYPAGGRQGTTFRVVLGGQNVAGAYEVYLSGSGVQATVKEYSRPLTPAQANTLREQMQELNQKRAKGDKLTAAEEATLLEIRGKLMEFQRRPSSAAIAETVVLEMTIGAHAEPGTRELRIGATAGITNPILIQVGDLPEVTREISKVPPAFNAVNGATPQQRPLPQTPPPPAAITLPAALNGQMMPATVDRYRFHAARGQHLVAMASARELVPYISDAVPGWFQATLTLRDPAGKQVAYADHYYFHPDPVLRYDVPQDGDYTLEIHDSLFRGREDFVYRIAVGADLPLPGAALPNAAINAKAGIGRRERAQLIKLPANIGGSVAKPGESEFFRFDGKAGEDVVAEVTARRGGSPLDSILILTDAAGRQIAVNDDFEDKGTGLLTHQADSRIACKLPAKGPYFLQLGDTQQNGGPEFAYRLRVSHPQPDFELRVTPSSLNLRGGTTVPLTVHALRRDGFAGEIPLKLKDAPQGFVLSGGVIPAGQDKLRLTLTAPMGPLDLPVRLQLDGRATIEGREVHHTAVPAQDMMQAFAYHHLVTDTAWMVRVVGAGALRVLVHPASEKAVKVPAGGSTSLDVTVAPRVTGQIHLELNDPPEGIRIDGASAVNGGIVVTVRADPAKAKPGLKGNLILDVYLERPDAKAAANRRQLWGTLPAVPFEVTATSNPRGPAAAGTGPN